MTHTTEQWYQTSDKEIVQDDWRRANERTGDPVEPTKELHILDLEEFAFSLLNQLGDDYGIYEDGSISYAIQMANTAEEMNPIITQLQTALLEAMKSAAGF